VYNEKNQKRKRVKSRKAIGMVLTMEWRKKAINNHERLHVIFFLSQPMKPVHGEPTPAEDGADEGLDCALDNANTV
jgi:hypothetical protein